MSDRFDLQQHDDGQVYLSESGRQMLHAQVHGPHDVTVQVGGDARVRVDKLYGPLVFWDIRVSLDMAACEWVIERLHGPGGEWREAARIPGQLAEDFVE